MYEELTNQARTAACELLEAAKLSPGDILVVGCSSSEALGRQIGSYSSEEAARAIFDGIYPVVRERGVYLAAQCCEHLNRAIIIEREAAERCRLNRVNAVPQPKAGGSFAATAYVAFGEPWAVEGVRAQAGMDIGDTLIGMHLARVAVPVRLSIRRIGEANLVCARNRPPFTGGGRTHYDDSLN